MVGHVGIDDVERLARAVEQLGDRGRDRTVPAGRVVEHLAGTLAPRLVLREEGVELLGRDRAAEPAEAGEEDELELRDDRPGDADEQSWKRPSCEVVLDPRAADPADAAVDDEELAVVDAPQLYGFHRTAPPGRAPARRPWLAARTTPTSTPPASSRS